MSAEQSTTPVEYRNIPGFPGYQAGDDGTIRVLHNTRRRPCEPRIIQGTVTPKGYRRVMIQSGPGQCAMKMVHDLVLTAFVGARPDGMECCHWDGDKLNNRLGNLRWDTTKANAADSIRQGRRNRPIGEANPNAGITEAIVREIRRLIEAGFSNPAIAKRFGVTGRVVSKIKCGRTWTHVI